MLIVGHARELIVRTKCQIKKPVVCTVQTTGLMVNRRR
ncbi:hypothetical protein BSU04_17550 [Caballeronia sordidicola]|uniref:Uncharacterized protein n=1 Tax=Caballeronia sordidicola TaxID=196367 RepID=A0A226X2X7_CABSO|nr:hypothetical protein BSU04_17550 [Caballeronia sordidicola]